MHAVFRHLQRKAKALWITRQTMEQGHSLAGALEVLQGG